MAAAVQLAPCDPSFPGKNRSKCPSPHRRKSPRRSLSDADRLPTPDEIERCGDLPIIDATGRAMPFKDLYNRDQRHLVIFVRHFFCGMCQDFLRSLAAAVSPQALTSLATPTQLTIVSCGSPDLIDDYAQYSNNCPFPIYTDPSRQLYAQFDMPSNLEPGAVKPAYQTSNILAMASRNIWQGISSGSGAFKGGNFSQLGGEMLFENGKVVWCHRMQNTRDHTDVDELKKVLGL